MELIGLTAALISASFIGFNILYAALGRFNKLSFPETVFLSYGAGLGAVSLEMLIFYLLGLKFNITWILAPWIVLIAANALRYIRRGNAIVFAERFAPPDEKKGALNSFLVFGITIETAYAFFRALVRPIEAYDAVAIYAIKSKIFFLAAGIPPDYFSALARSLPHPDYPLNIPLCETFIYTVMGSLNDQLVKAVFPLFFAGILCVLFFAVRKFATRTYALLFTFLLASIPMFNSYAANAYQELPLAFYYFTSAVFLFAWIEDRGDLRTLAVSAALVALAGWTKNEGMLYCAINIVLVILVSFTARKDAPGKSVYAPAVYAAVIILILAPWLWVKQRCGLVNGEVSLAGLNPVYLAGQLYKLGPILYELQKQLFGPKKWLILWPVVIYAAIFRHKSIFASGQRYISISLILAFCGYVICYMISPLDVAYFASKTWARFMLHFLPLAVLWLARMLKEDIKI
ncbi:MAG: hypothetical protein V1682_05535 [Candidatus Omnitrophota bacterium]